jgi:outer membrane receptor for ferrienterochelin and colicin
MNKHLMALAVAGVFAAAHAQDDTSDKIEKVEVTATRTGAVDVQQVPAAITVIKPDSLTKYGQGTLSDIANLVPAISLQEQGAGVNNITIRGLAVRGIVPSEVQDASLVAVYIDEMPVTLKSAIPT